MKLKLCNVLFLTGSSHIILSLFSFTCSFSYAGTLVLIPPISHFMGKSDKSKRCQFHIF
jgi:hypothetical protein